MDDLSHEGNLRNMVVSTISESCRHHASSFASHSCPEIQAWPIEPYGCPAASLPDHLETHMVFGAPAPLKRRLAPPHPCTEPESRNEETPEHKRPLTDNLVLVSCLIVDPILATDFTSKYESMQRSTHVDFNSLDVAVGGDGWFLVLDFFSGSNNADETVSSKIKDDTLKRKLTPTNYISKSELNISVRSLTITMVHKNGSEVGRINVSGVRLKRLTDTSNVTIETDGRLGSMSIIDLTPNGRLYRKRFQTLGERALNFNYKSTLERRFLSIEMATVLYVHTRRFVAEVQSCLAAFMGEEDVTTEGRRKKHKEEETERPGVWMSLEVQAGAPVILLPVYAGSEDVLVADLGNFFCSQIIFMFS